MIEIYFTEIDGLLYKVKSIGHAHYAPPGQDIVCAAVSAVLTGLMHEVSRYTTKADYKADSGDAELEIKPNEQTQILMEYACNTLAAIAESYPDNIRVITIE